MFTSKPLPTEYAPYFNRYVDLVAEAEFPTVLAEQPAEYDALLSALSPAQAGFRYGADKWTIREVLGHVIDTERVFGYRALCIARGETASLHSFDQDAYAAQAGHDRAALPDLLEEFRHIRRGHLFLFKHLDQPAWERAGTVNNNAITVRSLAYMIAGHTRHHAGILKERYLVAIGG